MAWRDPWETVDRANALRGQQEMQGLQALGAIQGMQTNALQRQQLQGQLSDQERARTKALALENALTGMQPGATPEAVIAAVSRVDPMKGIEMQRALDKQKREAFGKIDPKDFTPDSVVKFAASQNYGDLVPVREMKVGPGGQVYNPFEIKPGQVFNDPNKAFGIGKDGNAVPNVPFQNYELTKAERGAAKAPVVNVNTAQKPMLTELGKAVGERISTDFTAARAAVDTLNNANQIESALGKVIVGPGANVRLKLEQFGQILGVKGADQNEVLQNTRSLMQGLARQELAAAGQMKGQGQITESERGILRRAEAGDISELTVPEIRTLLSAIRKTANYRIGTHNENLQRLRNDPNAAGVVDYMTINAPQAVSAPSAPNPGKVRRYNPATGGFE